MKSNLFNRFNTLKR